MSYGKKQSETFDFMRGIPYHCCHWLYLLDKMAESSAFGQYGCGNL